MFGNLVVGPKPTNINRSSKQEVSSTFQTDGHGALLIWKHHTDYETKVAECQYVIGPENQWRYPSQDAGKSTGEPVLYPPRP